MNLPELDLSRLKILVVDDSKFMRAIVVNVLNALNCKDVVTATDGADAFDRMQSYSPDIIITNWFMSPLDGIEFTRMLRAKTDEPEEMTPVIMLTAFTESFRVGQARDAGVNEFLAKPISAKVLYSRLVSVVMYSQSFVRAPNYTGPCRRRHSSEDYIGPRKRNDDAPLEESTLQSTDKN